MNEYIIVNKTTIEKRIQELKKPIAHYDGIYVSDVQKAEFEALEEILSQSTPLIPEIEKAFDEGSSAHCNSQDWNHPTTFDQDKQNYISNLKLDI